MFTVLGDEPELNLRAAVLTVGRHKPQDVGVMEEAGLVDVHLVRPRRLFHRVEYFHSHIIKAISGLVHAPISPFTDELMEVDLLGDGAVNEQREAGARARAFLSLLRTDVCRRDDARRGAPDLHRSG